MDFDFENYEENFDNNGNNGNDGNVEKQIICPICGRPMNKFQWGYSCSGYKDENNKCDFSMGFKLGTNQLTEAQTIDLIEGREISISNYHTKKGTTISCKIKRKENSRDLEFSFENNNRQPAEQTGETCPQCGRPMVRRNGKNGPFEACSGYPECKYIKPTVNSQPKQTGEMCPQCGKPLVERIGSYGKFVSCSGYPECKYIKK